MHITKETHDYLVPDYYTRFECKQGQCRSACCMGWPISVSIRDYFKLIGVDCGKTLRARLDCAMHIVDYPSPERYAQITPRFDGDCPLRLSDGRCAIHAELGEDALPLICRLYPRGPRSEGDYECSCASSCEGVLELMFRDDAPISFKNERLTFELPKASGRTVFFETVGREQEIRLYFIRRLQDRRLDMPQRLMAFWRALSAMEAALNAGDGEQVERLLTGDAPVDTAPLAYPEGDQLVFGLQIAEKMVALIDERSNSVREYGEAALAYFGGDDPLEKYRQAKRHFDEALPRWQIYFEHMLVNHMFFERFPFQDRPESLGDEFLALCSVYALLRFLGLGWMANRESESDFVDVAAAAFRLIDHTNFDRYASHMLRNLKCDTLERVYNLILL